MFCEAILQQSVPRKKRTAAFTLIELLVVISIMSLLMSMLLPGLNRAREQGQRTVCLSNLRQLTFAWTFYTMDNDDQLCSAETYWNNPDNNWVADGPYMPGNFTGGTETAIETGSLWNYTGQMLDLYKCKTDSSDRLRSYSISRTMNGHKVDCDCGIEDDKLLPYQSLTEISRPAEKMVFVDADSTTSWIDGSFRPFYHTEQGEPLWKELEINNITARHNGGCCVSFADLHTSYIKWKDERTIEVANWQIDRDSASIDNPDLQYMVKMARK